MFFEGNVSSVLGAMHEKKRLLESGDPHDHIRPLLFICGGVMKGVYGGGVVTALHEQGMGEVFDVVAGVSTGAATAVYFLSGQPRLGTKIYSEECCTRMFINPWRFREICDTAYLMNVFRTSEKQLDIESVLRHRSKLVLGVTHRENAQQHLLTPRVAEELFECLHASILMPGVSTSEVCIQGMRCIDGSYSDPLPIESLRQTYSPTHIVVIANRERSLADQTPVFERFLNNTLFRFRMSKELRRVANDRRAVLSAKFKKLLQQKEVPALIFWGDGTVQSFTRNSTLLSTAAEGAYRAWKQHLGGQQ